MSTSLQSEVDEDLFNRSACWCVYFHSRPDGSVFYVGKGRRRRAYSFSPSRRTLHHTNIVKKYGRNQILVTVIPCAYEEEAFQLERVHIAIKRSDGLVNLTDGGEGVAGRKPSAAQLEGLKLGRGKNRKLSAEAMQVMVEALARGRAKTALWRTTPAGQAHAERLAQIGKEVLHRERTVRCSECGIDFVTRSAKARCCGRLCEQRNRRRRTALITA